MAFRVMLLSPFPFGSRSDTGLSTSISVLLRPPQLGSFGLCGAPSRPFPNWTGAFRRIQLSRPETESALTAYPLAVRALRHTVADFSAALFPFPVYRALPRSFEYYENSVAMSLSADRRSRSSLVVPVRT
jgi:hypothetical protein